MIIAKGTLLGLAILPMLYSNGHCENLNWGMEASQCGNNSFSIIAGDGKDIYLNSVSGVLSAAIVASDTSTEREALFSIAANTATNGRVTGDPSNSGYNNEVNRGLFVASIKQVGQNVIHIPFNVNFTTPMLVPGGNLAANFSIATSDPATNPGPNLCLDAEAHIELVWQTSPPANVTKQ